MSEEAQSINKIGKITATRVTVVATEVAYMVMFKDYFEVNANSIRRWI